MNVVRMLGCWLGLALACVGGCASDDFWESHYRWAAMHARLGEYDEVARGMHRALELVAAPEADAVGRVLVPATVAALCLDTGEHDVALALAERAVAAVRDPRLHPPERAVGYLALGFVHSARGEGAKALRACRLGSDLNAGAPGYRDPVTPTALHCRGLAHLALGEVDDAEALLEESRELRMLRRGEASPFALQILPDLATLYLAQSRPERALAEIESAEAFFGSRVAETHAAGIRIFALQAEALEAMGRAGDAQRSRERSARIASQTPSCVIGSVGG